MHKYQRRRRKIVSEINVVPYIDVMLVLLIIFMVTAPLLTQGVKVDLPQASSDKIDTKSQLPLIATVDINGKYYLNDKDNIKNKRPISAVNLQNIVNKKIRKKPDLSVVVRGDKNVTYEKIVKLMVLLQQAGVPSVGLMTEEEQR